VDLEKFRESLAAATPPAGLSKPLQALWREAHGDWSGAHRIVQSDKSKAAAAVHAYLHRKEGDLENANYWYARAERERPRGNLGKEWETLVTALLNGDGG
jgi:hypothetical protein